MGYNGVDNWLIKSVFVFLVLVVGLDGIHFSLFNVVSVWSHIEYFFLLYLDFKLKIVLIINFKMLGFIFIILKFRKLYFYFKSNHNAARTPQKNAVANAFSGHLSVRKSFSSEAFELQSRVTQCAKRIEIGDLREFQSRLSRCEKRYLIKILLI